MPRLKEKYENEIKGELKQRFGIENDLAIPRLRKIVINMGVKGAVGNKARAGAAVRDRPPPAGPRPTLRLPRRATAGLTLREGMPIGCAVPLRRDRMWEFADRLISIVLPRIRDFRGVKDKLDGRGNYTLGLSEQSVFPEIDFDKIESQQGMDITFVTTAASDEQGHALFRSRPRKPDGQDLAHRQVAAQAQVLHSGLHALHHVRPRARRVPEVRDLPDLPAQARLAR